MDYNHSQLSECLQSWDILALQAFLGCRLVGAIFKCLVASSLLKKVKDARNKNPLQMQANYLGNSCLSPPDRRKIDLSWTFVLTLNSSHTIEIFKIVIREHVSKYISKRGGKNSRKLLYPSYVQFILPNTSFSSFPWQLVPQDIILVCYSNAIG